MVRPQRSQRIETGRMSETGTAKRAPHEQRQTSARSPANALADAYQLRPAETHRLGTVIEVL